MLGRKDVVKVCSSDWIMKWTPAILRHSDALTGKAGAVYKHNQMASQGMLYNIRCPRALYKCIMTVLVRYACFIIKFVQLIQALCF